MKTLTTPFGLAGFDSRLKKRPRSRSFARMAGSGIEKVFIHLCSTKPNGMEMGLTVLPATRGSAAEEVA
jgi:hypothetical protein